MTLTPGELARRIGSAYPPTAEQEMAITAPLGPCAVVAAAGSGKTQTMAMRVVWLVANGHVPPHRVLGLTFTRKAAAQLGDRVRRTLRGLLAAHDAAPFLADEVAVALRTGEPTVATYHSYAAALVDEHALRVGREPRSDVVGPAMAWQLAARVVEGYDGPMEAVDRALLTVVDDVLGLAGELAEHLRTPEEVRALSDAVHRRVAGLPAAPKGTPPAVRELLAALEQRTALLPLVEAYTDAKRARGALDYGDQVALAARIARDHPEVGEAERGRYAVVLLDEYQDTGEAQRVLLTSLFGGGHPVTAVGDPRQAIYGWRGASAGNLERFPEDFPSADGSRARSAGLTASFRNGEAILGAANAVASAIPIRGLDDSPLVPGAGREGAGRVECAAHDSAADEAAWVARRVRAAGDAGTPWGEIAVLARKRSLFPRIESALRDLGVPCEVVGLGGLLLEPEVADLHATLRVLGDPSAGDALVRLLTGPRWRIGPRDLDALGRRARHIAHSGAAAGTVGGSPGAGHSEQRDPEPDVVDDRSLVDALDDLGDPHGYSPVGFRRLDALREELRGLRRWTAQPLPDLVAAVARTLCLDVELAARPGVRPGDALVNVERFVEVAEDFTATGEDPGLLAFLAYLDAAADQERGLEQDIAEPDAERVQVLSIHAAKGLEWDVVVVAGMTSTVFPVTGQPVADWTKQCATLPFPLRGDRRELPELDLADVADQAGARAAVLAFRDGCKERAALEERRLAYVALTRARELLVCSGYWWDDATKPRGPSELLLEVRDATRAEVGGCGGEAMELPFGDAPPEPPGPLGPLGPPWIEDPSPENPLTAVQTVRPWPADPLGDRRSVLEASAERVARAAAAAAGGAPIGGPVPPPYAELVEGWVRDVELLLEEQRRHRAGASPDVELPEHLSVSQLVALRRDPDALARRIRRPVPAQPRPLARRGTRFHAWLEERWGQQRLLDIDELPGSADESAEPDADLLALQGAFRASPWWHRVPLEVEFPFDMTVEGVILRGRSDAVFATDGGGVEVVDWKTGSRPLGVEAEAAAVQLAAYRLAWHHLTGTPLGHIGAAFHYVRSGATVRPVDLLDADGLAALIRSVPLSRRDGGGDRGRGRSSS